jgi:hypothetical protein
MIIPWNSMIFPRNFPMKIPSFQLLPASPGLQTSDWASTWNGTSDGWMIRWSTWRQPGEERFFWGWNPYGIQKRNMGFYTSYTRYIYISFFSSY